MTWAVPPCPSVAEFTNLIYTVLNILFPDLIMDPTEGGHRINPEKMFRNMKDCDGLAKPYKY